MCRSGTHHDYGIDDSINRADYLSNAVLQDTYEAAKSSRGKDHALLRNLNAAIVSMVLRIEVQQVTHVVYQPCSSH